jgi:hypothetical protein
VTSAQFSQEKKILLNKSPTPSFFGLRSGENLLVKKIWLPYKVANNMKGCKLFNVLRFHFNQNLAKLFYG